MSEDLPSAAQDLLGAVCQKFREAWNKGEKPKIEDYVQQIEPSLQRELLKRLVDAELNLRTLLGETLVEEQYLQRFPHDTETLQSVLNAAFRTVPDSEEATLDWAGNTPPLRPAPLGAKKIDRFQLLERIGQGMLGEVYRAHDPQLDRYVALKIIHHDRLANPDESEKIVKRLKAVSLLRHPNLVQVHDVGQLGGLSYVSMACITGVSLRQRLVQGEPFKFREAAELIQLLAETLSFAHAQGFLHLDVRPENVILSTRGEPHLSDLGLCPFSLITGDLNRDVSPYTSPEQLSASGNAEAASCDIYGLGVMLYELLTGHPPFTLQGEKLVEAIMHAPIVEPRAISRVIPVGLESICLRCLLKSPSARYATCKQLSDALLEWLKRDLASSQKS